MLRSTMVGLWLVFIVSVLPLNAQKSEAQWKTAYLRGLNMVGAKNYSAAEQDLLNALREAERLGPADIRVASTANTLGLLYMEEKKYADAEKCYRRALPIFEKVYGATSIDTGNVNFNLSNAMLNAGRYSDALPYIARSKQIYEAAFGQNSVKAAAVYCQEGQASLGMKNFAAAEGPLRRCAEIREANGGLQNVELGDAVFNLAQAYVGLGKYDLAEPRFRLAEKIREKMLGLTSPVLAQTMEEHAALLKLMGRQKEADKLNGLVAAIRRTQTSK